MIAGDGMHVTRCCCAVLLEGACLQGCISVLMSQCLRGSRLVAAQDREDVCVCVCGRVGGGARWMLMRSCSCSEARSGETALSEWSFDRFCLGPSENSWGVPELSGVCTSLELLHELSHKEESL